MEQGNTPIDKGSVLMEGERIIGLGKEEEFKGKS